MRSMNAKLSDLQLAQSWAYDDVEAATMVRPALELLNVTVEQHGAIFTGRKQGTQGDLIGYVRHSDDGFEARSTATEDNGVPLIIVWEARRADAVATFLLYADHHGLLKGDTDAAH